MAGAPISRTGVDPAGDWRALWCLVHDNPEADEGVRHRNPEVKGENHGLHGKERSEEVKKRISEKLKDREFSEETRNRISESLTGKTIPPEVRAKISKSLRGVEKSDQTRRRMRQSKSGDVESPTYSHWMQVAYNRGFKPAKREVHLRDEVCQVCYHDGSTRKLEVHHIIPVRLFRDIEGLEFIVAHSLGNLILLCQTCHPKVERGSIEIKPNFEAVPEEYHEAFQQLWEAHVESQTSEITSGGS